MALLSFVNDEQGLAVDLPGLIIETILGEE
jgi:hypothetical protein